MKRTNILIFTSNFSLVWLLVVNYKLHLCRSDVRHASNHRAGRARNTEDVIAYGLRDRRICDRKKSFELFSWKAAKRTCTRHTVSPTVSAQSWRYTFYFVLSFSADGDAAALHILFAMHTRLFKLIIKIPLDAHKCIVVGDSKHVQTNNIINEAALQSQKIEISPAFCCVLAQYAIWSTYTMMKCEMQLNIIFSN